MPIAFRAAGTASAGASSITPGLPAGTAPNDILIGIVSATGNTAFTWPGGWTEIAVSNYTASRRWEARWRRAGSSESAPGISYSGSNVIFGQIAGYSGCVIVGSPVDQVGAVTNGSTATQTHAALTPTVPNTELVMAGTNRDGTTTMSAYSGANPAPSERFDSATATGSTAVIYLASGLKDDTTTSGARTATRSGPSGIDYSTVMFNLIPAVNPSGVSLLTRGIG